MTDSFSVGLDPRALDEVAEASLWYEEQRLGLGDAFLRSFDEAIEELAVRPQVSPPMRSWPSLRRRALGRFPYSLIYRVEEKAQEVQVLSCWHQRRDPASLARRLQGGE